MFVGYMFWPLIRRIFEGYMFCLFYAVLRIMGIKAPHVEISIQEVTIIPHQSNWHHLFLWHFKKYSVKIVKVLVLKI